jgi:sigma-E factor negative regulatory protein RseB
MPLSANAVHARRLGTLIAVLGAMAATAAYAGDGTADEARAWLERMSKALATRNYDGRFVHLVGGRAENMRIIHSVTGGSVSERLISLDGSGREIVRTEDEVVCYLPDRRTVLVEKRRGGGSLLSAVPTYSDELQNYYTLSAPGETRILGRAAQFVVVQPRDRLRYGYRLWLDRETAIPLKSQLCDREGRVIEQIVFSDLRTPPSIDASLLRTSIDTEGFRWIRQDAPARRAAETGSIEMSWMVVNPPEGFRVTVTRVQSFAGSTAQHLVLSDGLASVSVFIEPRASQSAQAQPAGPEVSRLGSALAYSTEADDHRITAVGEVPVATLRAIANAVQPGVQSAVDVNRPAASAQSR